MVARFDGGAMISDGGGLLLRATEERLNLVGLLARCFDDHRELGFITHTVAELVTQRV